MKKSYFGRALLFFEAAWAVFWLVCVFVFQLADGDFILLRNAFIVTAFHAVCPAVIYDTVHRVERNSSLPWISVFVLAFAWITDLFSLLETTLHVRGHAAEYLFGMLLAVTATAIALSSVAIVWFIGVKGREMWSEKRVKQVLYDFTERRMKNGF